MTSSSTLVLPSMEALGRNPGKLSREERRMQVLSRYTASENFPVLSSIINAEIELSEADRARMKMSRLAIRTEGESHLQASQIELIGVIENMDAELKSQWAVGDRVKSLRIAIQAIKLLGHTKVPQCYPSLFILAATVLDTFGDLVADRISATACQLSPLITQLIAQGKEPDPSIIPAPAVEMCNNWFLKILSIRELLPRVYVELSLMRTYRYVAKKFRIDSMRAVVERLAMQVRGVADPLVAVHARWYVCLRAAEVLAKSDPHWGEAMILCCEDNLQLISKLPPYAYESKGLTRAAYVALFKPAMQWLFDTVATHSTESAAEQIFDRALRMIELDGNVRYASLLSTLVNAFNESIVFSRIDRVLALVTAHDKGLIYDGTPRLEIISAVCHVIAETPAPLPMPKSQKLALINTLWEHVQIDSGNFEGFLTACRGLLRLLAAHATTSQCSVLVSAVTDRCREEESSRAAAAAMGGSSGGGGTSPAAKSPTSSKPRLDRAGVDRSKQVFFFMATLLQSLPSEVVFSMWTSVMPLMNLMTSQHHDTIARQLLNNAPATHRFSATVAELCRQVHDGLSTNARKELVDATSTAVCRAIRQCFTTDVPQQLRFMCECRHGLPMLDHVKITLVQEGIRLAQATAAAAASAPSASAQRSRRGAAKGCFAFCHATAPGIADASARLSACMSSASVAFHLGFVAQAESLLQLAVAGLNDVLTSSGGAQGDSAGASRMGAYAKAASLSIQLLNIGAAAPPHAKYGHLYSFAAVLAWTSNFSWPEGVDWPWRIACAALALIGALRAGTLPLAFGRCPKPALLVQDPAFDEAARNATCQAVLIIQKYMGTNGRVAVGVLEGASQLFTSDQSTPAGPLLQRSIRLLAGNQTTFDDNEAAYTARKKNALQYAKDKLGAEVYHDVLSGPELKSLDLDEYVAGMAASETAVAADE